MTIEQAVFYIMEQLGQNSDDSNVPERLVMAYLDTARKAVMGKSAMNNIPSSMIKAYNCQLLRRRDIGCDNCEEEVYLTLPVKVMSMMDDLGVQDVRRPGGISIPRAGGPGMVTFFEHFRVHKESWHQLGGDLIFKGKFPENLKVRVHLIPDSLEDFNLSDDFPAPGDLIQPILEEAEKIGRRKLQVPEDKISDGD